MFDVQKDPNTAALNHSLCCISLDILWSCNRLPVISKKEIIPGFETCGKTSENIQNIKIGIQQEYSQRESIIL